MPNTSRPQLTAGSKPDVDKEREHHGVVSRVKHLGAKLGVGLGSSSRRRYRHRYRASRMVVTALVIVLLVPAGVLALRSLWVSLAAADELDRQERVQVTQEMRAKKEQGPFVGTQAATFAEGEAGILVPEAQQVGEWPADQVAGVAEAVRKLLVTARLDPRVHAGDTQPYVEQLAVSTRQFTLDKLASGGAALGYATRFAPEYSVKAPPRVKGGMTVSVGDKGQLVVVADYVWVYALEGEMAKASKKSEPGAKLVVVHSLERYEWYPEKGYLPEDHGLRPGNGELYTFNMDCEFASQGLLALPRTVVKKNATSIGKAIDPATAPGTLPSSC